jgi:hypothetical protein
MVVVPGYGMVIWTERGDMFFSYIQVLNVDPTQASQAIKPTMRALRAAGVHRSGEDAILPTL